MNKKKWFLLLTLIAISLLLYINPLGFSFGSLLESKEELLFFIKHHFYYSLLFYALIYITIAALGIPSPSLMAYLGGFLFGPLIIIVASISATTGATLCFILTRTLYQERMQQKYENHLARIEKELKEHGHWYLLSVRLVPFFPFTLTNIFLSLLPIPLSTCIWTTALGSLPLQCFYVYAGVTSGKISSFKNLFSVKLLLIFTILFIFALLPVALKKYKERHKEKNS